jgi:hypothetical protein
MTSIEWLFEKLWEHQKDKLTWHSILNKATEMHKAEMGNKFISDEEFNKIYSQLMRTQKLSLYDDKISNDYQLGYLHGVQWIYQILKERQ